MSSFPEPRWPMLDDAAAMKRIGERVRALRMKRGLRQRDAAAAAGISVQTYNNLENTGRCTLATLLAVTRAFGEFERMDILKEDAA